MPEKELELIGGLNSSTEPDDLADNEAAALENVIFSPLGTLGRRPGTPKVNSVFLGEVRGLAAYTGEMGQLQFVLINEAGQALLSWEGDTAALPEISFYSLAREVGDWEQPYFGPAAEAFDTLAYQPIKWDNGTIPNADGWIRVPNTVIDPDEGTISFYLLYQNTAGSLIWEVPLECGLDTGFIKVEVDAANVTFTYYDGTDTVEIEEAHGLINNDVAHLAFAWKREGDQITLHYGKANEWLTSVGDAIAPCTLPADEYLYILGDGVDGCDCGVDDFLVMTTFLADPAWHGRQGLGFSEPDEEGVQEETEEDEVPSTDPPDCDCEELQDIVRLYLPWEGDILDYSEQAHPFAAVAGGPVFLAYPGIPGSWGRAADFRGAPYALLAATPANDLSVDLTLGTPFYVWLYPGNGENGEAAQVYSHGYSHQNIAWLLYQSASRCALQVRYKATIGGSPTDRFLDSLPLWQNNLYHMALEFTASQCRLYVQGVLMASAYHTGATAVGDADVPFLIGQAVTEGHLGGVLQDEFTVVRAGWTDSVRTLGVEGTYQLVTYNRPTAFDRRSAIGNWANWANTYDASESTYGECVRTRVDPNEEWAHWYGWPGDRPANAHYALKVSTSAWGVDERWGLYASDNPGHSWQEAAPNVEMIKAMGTEQVTEQFYTWQLPVPWDRANADVWMAIEANGPPSSQTYRNYDIREQEGSAT